MIYGSYSGGIFVKELDAQTGEPLEDGYGNQAFRRQSSAY